MYFNIKVDYKEKKIRLIVTNINNDIVDDITSWSFDLLKEKLERKLMFLCYVEANKVFYKNKLYVKYTNDEYFKLKGFDNFIQLIDNGVIGISFKIGTFKSGKRKIEIKKDRAGGLFHPLHSPFDLIYYTYFTVTSQVFTTDPLRTVIVAVPLRMPLTTPLEVTVAIFLFEDV